MLCEVAIHDWFQFEEDDERNEDAEFTNLWITGVDLPIEEMKEMTTEEEIVSLIIGIIMMSGNWMLPEDSYDYEVNANYRPNMHERFNKAFAKADPILQSIYCFDSYDDRLDHDVILNGWHIVREKTPGNYEWLGQGSSFCEDKFIN